MLSAHLFHQPTSVFDLALGPPAPSAVLSPRSGGVSLVATQLIVAQFVCTPFCHSPSPFAGHYVGYFHATSPQALLSSVVSQAHSPFLFSSRLVSFSGFPYFDSPSLLLDALSSLETVTSIHLALELCSSPTPRTRSPFFISFISFFCFFLFFSFFFSLFLSFF